MGNHRITTRGHFGTLRPVCGSALLWLGGRCQSVFAVDADQLAGNSQAHKGKLDLFLGEAIGQGGNKGSPAAWYAIAEQLEDAGRDTGDHGMDVGGGRVTGRHRRSGHDGE